MSGYRLDRPNINGRRSDTWYVVWSEKGRSRRVSTKETDRWQAERFLAEYAAALDLPPQEFDIAMLVRGYLEEAPGEHHHAKAVIRLLGPLSPSSLTRARVRMFHKARRAEGASDSTINRQSRVLRAALEWGRKEGWLKELPHIDAPTPAPPRERFLTRPEFARLYEAAEQIHLRTFLALAVYTGQRAAAILELTWDDIDTENMLVRYQGGNATKRRTPYVPISAPLALTLSTAMLDRNGPFVVHWRGEPITSIKKAFGAAVRRAGLHDVRIHDLRRTAASWVLDNGGSFDMAAALLSDDVRTVRRHYARFSDEFMVGITGRIAG
jgi:integrase